MKLLLMACIFILTANPELLAQNAPVTTCGRVTDAIPGDTSVQVSVTVRDFNDIGQFTLTMKFDTTRLTYTGASVNDSLEGMSVDYFPPSGNNIGKLVFTWTGQENVSLPDSTSLAVLTFHYITGTGLLTWSYTYTNVCFYKRYVDNELFTLNDSPKYQFYRDGGISDRAAPVAVAPDIQNPLPGPLPLLINVEGFSDISALTLYLEYDPAVISYQDSFTANPAFDTNFIVGVIPVSGGKMDIVIQWYGSPVDLADGATLCTLDFIYPEATCDSIYLSWFDNGPSCEYADGSGDVLLDLPAADYYLEGFIGAGLPVVWTGNVSNVWNEPGNWTECGVPTSRRKVLIPDVSPNPFPVINNSVSCVSVTLENGALLTISSSGSVHIGN